MGGRVTSDLTQGHSLVTHRADVSDSPTAASESEVSPPSVSRDCDTGLLTEMRSRKYEESHRGMSVHT